MIVEIFSMTAAVGGGPHGTTWRGDVFDDRPVDDELLEDVYRFFNRVGDGDHERMLSVGYKLPSLSVGDYVTFHPEGGPITYQVASVGFRPVTGDPSLLVRAMAR